MRPQPEADAADARIDAAYANVAVSGGTALAAVLLLLGVPAMPCVLIPAACGSVMVAIRGELRRRRTRGATK